MASKIKINPMHQNDFGYGFIKSMVIASMVGLLAGTATAVFLTFLHMGEDRIHRWNDYYLLLPFVFYLSSLLVVKFIPSMEEWRTDKLIARIQDNTKSTHLRFLPVKLAAVFIALICGASAGKAGPCAQIGAGITYGLANFIHIQDKNIRKWFILYGISASFSGIFGAPIAATIFAAEMLCTNIFSWRLFAPIFTASYISYHINKLLAVPPLSEHVYFSTIHEANLLINLIIFAFFMGLLSMFFLWLLKQVEAVMQKINLPSPPKGMLGGLILITIVYITDSTDYIGLGTNVINRTLLGEAVFSFAFLLKIFTVCITLGTIKNGGLLTPVFYIGATAGNTWSQLMGSSLPLFSCIGMVALLAPCTKTPLAAIILSVELFGIKVSAYTSIVCIITYLMVIDISCYAHYCFRIRSILQFIKKEILNKIT
ncbi:chloride channel protein [Clostridiaceae bacterium 35-E11]